jgi:hypothetical protein
VKISTSSMAFIDASINITVVDKTFQISVMEERERKETGECRGGQRVVDWASTASSVASAADREAIAVGVAISGGLEEDRDMADVGTEGFDCEDGKGREGQFNHTRNDLDKRNGEAENFMIELGNSQPEGVQVSVVGNVRRACDGSDLQGQQVPRGSLGSGLDGDKWQREVGRQEGLTIGIKKVNCLVDPTVSIKNSNLVVDGGLADQTGEEQGPIFIGPNSFGPLEDLNPEV